MLQWLQVKWIYDEDYKSWFYVDSTGGYVEKAWQGEYYLKRGGYMAKSEWVFDLSMIVGII